MSMVPYIRDQLIKVFTAPQADVLAHVVVEAHDALASKADVQELRGVVRELAEAQRGTNLTVAELVAAQRGTERSVAELAEAQRGTEREMGELRDVQKSVDRRMEKLAQSHQELAQSHQELAQSHRELAQSHQELATLQRTMLIRLDKTDGRMLEMFLRVHLPAYIGRHVRRCRILEIQDVVEELEPLVPAGTLAEAELDEIRRTDIIATGVVDGETIYIVGEVSRTGDNEDIFRAARRAALLKRAGKQVLPIVACDLIGPVAAELARREGVNVLRGGSFLPAAG